MATVAVRFDITIVDAKTGLWCPACLLPSGVEAFAALSNVDDPTRILGHLTHRICDTCELAI